jgi:hypothetical protein
LPEPPGSTPSSLFDTVGGVRAWHTAARDALLDLVSLAREGAHRRRRRVLSRGEMRRRTRDAFGQLGDLLDLALAPLEAVAATREGGARER